MGDLELQRGPVVLVEPDPRWSRMFAVEAERVRGALGDIAWRVEHVGSTSVPGLAAKPIIDMLLVVADSAAEGTYAPALESAGYVLRVREPGWYQHRLFRRPEAVTGVNLHVFSQGSEEVHRMLAFRDRLRTDEGDRALYLRCKRELAGRKWKFLQDYADAKSAVVEEILARAVDVRASEQARPDPITEGDR